MFSLESIISSSSSDEEITADANHIEKRSGQANRMVGRFECTSMGGDRIARCERIVVTMLLRMCRMVLTWKSLGR